MAEVLDASLIALWCSVAEARALADPHEFMGGRVAIEHDVTQIVLVRAQHLNSVGGSADPCIEKQVQRAADRQQRGNRKQRQVCGVHDRTIRKNRAQRGSPMTPGASCTTCIQGGSTDPPSRRSQEDLRLPRPN